MSVIINGDCLEELKNLADDSVDTVITDPPYGYSFMGKDWDKAVPSVEIWQECLRVLKPGAFACVMSAPRSDVQNAMISRLMEAGFRLDFTPIYWTYASGFPKAGNVGKLVDKRAGVEREVIGKYQSPENTSGGKGRAFPHAGTPLEGLPNITAPATDEAKALDGSYTGFQPKPAVEVIIVAMKPLSEKTYVDQALKNGKGVTWLDDCRVPTDLEAEDMARGRKSSNNREVYGKYEGVEHIQPHQSGRFPANLLVSDDVLNDGVVRKSGDRKPTGNPIYGGNSYNESKSLSTGFAKGDEGSYSRFFDLDAWARERLPEQQSKTFPFAIFAKASKSEKNKGLDHFEEKEICRQTSRKCANCGGSIVGMGQNNPCVCDNRVETNTSRKNHHPTVKPLKLMSYLITLFSREGDTVIDPFVGSGTTVVAAEQLGRKGIGIEREAEYAEIARARLAHIMPLPEEPESVPPVTMDEVLQSKPAKKTKPDQLSLF